MIDPHFTAKQGESLEQYIRENAALRAEVERLRKDMAYEKSYSLRVLECASRLDAALVECLEAMRRAYDKLEWLKGDDVRQVQSQIKAAAEHSEVARMGHPTTVGCPSVNPGGIKCQREGSHCGAHFAHGFPGVGDLTWNDERKSTAQGPAKPKLGTAARDLLRDAGEWLHACAPLHSRAPDIRRLADTIFAYLKGRETTEGGSR